MEYLYTGLREEREIRVTVDQPFITTLSDELSQHPRRRQELLKQIGNLVKRTAVVYFTSFRYRVMIDESDADMLEQVLQATDLTSGLCLILDTPGGSALAAEHIVRICQQYSKGNFEVLIPCRAKSAATMICFGAKKIYMGQSSALGPIGPQIIKREEDGTTSLISARAIIKTYDELMEKAITTEGHLEPYLQQLSRYNATEIEELRVAEELSVDIAVRRLREGMLAGLPPASIRRRIALFLDPEVSKAHGRDIYYEEVQRAGLNVELIPIGNILWDLALELHTRADYYVCSEHSKLIESPMHHFAMSAPKED